MSGTVSYGLAGLAAYGADHAWLAYGSDPQTPMMVMTTADGGRTWQQALVPVSGMGGSFSWPDTTHGWLLANQGVGAGNEYVAIARTVDGGASWPLQSGGDPQNAAPGGIPSGGLKSGIAARDATTAG